MFEPALPPVLRADAVLGSVQEWLCSATGLDESTPSRYALKVGDIDVMVISDGVLPITTTTMATNAAPDDLDFALMSLLTVQGKEAQKSDAPAMEETMPMVFKS